MIRSFCFLGIITLLLVASTSITGQNKLSLKTDTTISIDKNRKEEIELDARSPVAEIKMEEVRREKTVEETPVLEPTKEVDNKPKWNIVDGGELSPGTFNKVVNANAYDATTYKFKPLMDDVISFETQGAPISVWQQQKRLFTSNKWQGKLPQQDTFFQFASIQPQSLTFRGSITRIPALPPLVSRYATTPISFIKGTTGKEISTTLSQINSLRRYTFKASAGQTLYLSFTPPVPGIVAYILDTDGRVLGGTATEGSARISGNASVIIERLPGFDTENKLIPVSFTVTIQ